LKETIVRNLLFAATAALALTAFPARADDVPDQFRKEHCTMCHSADHKMIGPAYKDIAAKYKGDPKALDTLKQKIKAGGGGVWGAAKMPAHPNTSDADLELMVKWILAH
jgi:cytochrome c